MNALVSRKPRWYSPSQLTNWRGCRRRWSFRYIAGIKTPPTPAQALGTRLHKQIEDWFMKGEAPADARAAQGLRLLPAPALHIVAEGNIRFWI